jgi:hypothetical protein
MRTVTLPPIPSATKLALKKLVLQERLWIVYLVGTIMLNSAIRWRHPIPRTLFVGMMVVLFLLPGILAPLAFVQKLARDGADVACFTPEPAKLLSWPNLFPIFRALYFGPLLLALVLDVNSRFDHSPVESHPEVVIGKYVTTGRGGGYSYLKVSSSRPHASSDEFEVADPSAYDAFQVGDRITVNEHRGAFHIPWLEAVTKKP